ncbi:Rap30/74 interaction domain-containing protein [Delitschia confertaspora ATCC 74209]|uniref:Rap30/74 interaction domain-containing protein n=1 Tax=Delitschia confertaspora ATCC 74209 TaxID=1513339 RepID=A0A9P4MSS8_9PLEO|nr:Rap30/74 interaction domain-containing protein [Delitschia confertaspora ATCC 74209]
MNGQPQPTAAATARPMGARPPSISPSPAAIQGTTPIGPNGQPRRIRRRPQQTDPLRPAQRPLKQIARPIVNVARVNETAIIPNNGPSASDANTPVNLNSVIQEAQAQGAHFHPIVVSKRQLMEGFRHHIMRLQQSKEKGPVDIRNEAQFTRPVRLHRRDPRAPPSGAGANIVEEEEPENLEESKERERQEIIKEERRRIKEENQAKIAPSTTKKAPAFQKKTAQIYRQDDTPEAKKRSKLRYEEALPWHLEDFDNKQTWVGQYESELSEAHLLVAPEYDAHGNVKFRMTPVEKWYKFTPKGKGTILTPEEADQYWKKAGKLPKYFIEREQAIIKREMEESKRGSGMRTRIAGAGDDEAPRRFGGDDDDVRVKHEADADDIDFNMEEDFADDEEGVNGLFEGDEVETKEAQEKLRRDQLAARVFDLRNDQEEEEKEELERQEAEQKKKLEKRLRKALVKQEKNYDYEESDSNPYSSSSEDSDSEAERQKEKERKEEEEKKAAEQNGKAKDGDKPASGASTKGTTTPSGLSKPLDMNKKKRPGSPNLSEASGNESSRKKHKKKHLDPSRNPSLAPRGAGSGSDTDAGKKKQKLVMKMGKSPNGTPGGSRAASPDATQANLSRATSPTASTGRSTVSAQFPTPQEIYKVIPASGITIRELLRLFKGRLKGAENDSKLFINLVKSVGKFDGKMILPLPELPPNEVLEKAYRVTKK